MPGQWFGKGCIGTPAWSHDELFRVRMLPSDVCARCRHFSVSLKMAGDAANADAGRLLVPFVACGDLGGYDDATGGAASTGG